jgi:hypothetical protein
MSLRSMTIAGLILVFLTGCETVDSRLERAAELDAAIAGARELPDQPEDCRKVERSGVAVGDPLDTALMKTDAALGRANRRVVRCAEWYGDLKHGFMEGTN